MRALLLVDVQNDFMPGGPLAVPEGDAVVSVINRIQGDYDVVVATQDWHPADHGSFASQHPGTEPFAAGELDGIAQTFWPDHCVQGTRGAEFHPDLDMRPAVAIFRKGVERRIDSYSAFFDNGRRRHTGLGAWLRSKDVDTVHVAGLAAEICVAFTAADARELGFEVVVLEAAKRALDDAAWEEKAAGLRKSGVRIEPAS